VIGPEAPILWDPTVTEELDYEAELGVVIGKTGKTIPRDRAYEHIFGYTVITDATARDLQRQHGQWFKGKALDGSCPMGPYLVHKSRVPDPHALIVRLWVNGELRQEASTRDMIFDIPCLIEMLSRGMTLEPGDIIATGTPGGVGWTRTPPAFLRHGDLVQCEVAGIGTLRNRVERLA
jgi:2-keto-4-pentenoate hydratase/2-oxohepta-3-ene-1,7-dioic acid hydratase in catechol pathway